MKDANQGTFIFFHACNSQVHNLLHGSIQCSSQVIRVCISSAANMPGVPPIVTLSSVYQLRRSAFVDMDSHDALPLSLFVNVWSKSKSVTSLHQVKRTIKKRSNETTDPKVTSKGSKQA